MSLTRRSLLAAAPGLASVAGLAAAASPTPVHADPLVDELLTRATRAHQALMRGDVPGYRRQIELAQDFTLMAPFGGEPTHAHQLSEARWAAMGRFFRNGREATLELVQAWRSADVVVLAVIERAHVEVGGLAAQQWPLRVTLVFRREGAGWLLAHRHADPLVQGVSLEHAALLARGRTPT